MVDKSTGDVISGQLRHLTYQSCYSCKYREKVVNNSEIDVKCQQNTNRKSGSGFRSKIFSPLGGALISLSIRNAA
jgi:hypothetical protein